MKTRFLLWVLTLLLLPEAYAQSDRLPFQVRIEAIDNAAIPGIQSYVWAEDKGLILLIGGRRDGLHKRRPFEAFAADGNNTHMMVYDPGNNQLWSFSINGLSTNLKEQLQSTNMEYFQKGNDLIIAGGYAFSASAGTHITFPFLTHIQVKECIEAIKNNQSPEAYIRQIRDERFRVTGGYLGYLNDWYVLAGGQNFEGRYNPMGPNQGPGFTQVYTNSIRKFKFSTSGGNLSITDFREWKDSANLHRRDYNMVAQIDANGRPGLTMFSGVFQYSDDIPWLNCVDISADTFMVNNNAVQLLNQYHTAHIPLYSSSSRNMYTLFFGGIGQYFYNDSALLVRDDNVPFVNTISVMSRTKGSYAEFALDEKMPALLGASAEFIPVNNEWLDSSGIVMLDALPANEEKFLGYIIGGIQSDVPNGFFENTDQSQASKQVFKVYLNKSVSNAHRVSPEDVFQLRLLPNPANAQVTLQFRAPVMEPYRLEVMQSDGKVVYQVTIQSPEEPGTYKIQIPTDTWANGVYLLRFRNSAFEASEKLMIAH